MKSRIEVLIVGWGYPPDIDGGLDIHVSKLHRELNNKQGIEADLLLPNDRMPEKNRENIVGVETGEGDIIRRTRRLSKAAAAFAEEYDLIHTHDWLGAESGFKARKYGDVDWVSTMHSLSSDWGHGEAWDEVEKMEEIAVKKPDKLVAVSENLANKIRKRFGENPETVHNAFSKPETSGKDVKKELGIEEPMIFFVGRHAEQKGIEHLLLGFKRYLENQQASLVIGGEGYMTESLKEFSEMLDIERNVFFVGKIPSESLGDYYEAADLFVSPSINEPFGLTITEALESGTPVLATENGVTELTSNYIIDTEPHSERIAEDISKCLEMDLNVEINRRSWSEMADEVAEIYRDV
jgi:glycosyltransferase involved in cell wall biosynthesis